MMEDNVINRLIPRLKKIGIEIELLGNIPWIYLDSVNGNKIAKEDYFHGNHGFTIALYPAMLGQKMEILDIKRTFQIIRKYANDTTTGLPTEDSKRRAWHR